MAKSWFTAKDKPALIWLGAISALTHLPWLVLLRNFTSGDWWYIGIERYRDFAQFSPIWVTDGFGNTSAVPHFYLIRFLEGALTYLGSSFALNEKLFFLIPMAFAGSFGMYFLLRQYFGAWPAFIGAIVFSFNTPILFNHVGPLTIGTAYALAPWCIYFFKRFIDNISKPYMLATAAAFAIVAIYELRIALIIIAVCIGLFVYNTAIGEGWSYAKRRLLPLLALFSMVLALHAFWIIPYAVSSRAVTFSDLLSRGLFVSFSDIQNALTLQHPFWTGGRPATFIIQDIPLYAWIIPVAAFSGFVLRGKQTAREMYYWGIVAALGLFLVKQVNEPFVNVYPWLFGHVPGFGAYRESSKFYLLIALAFAVLIPFTLTALKGFLNDRFGSRRFGLTPVRILYGSACTIVLGLFLINTIPLLSGSFRTLYVPRTMPTDYQKLEQFIASQDSHFRTLWVPVTSRWGIVSNQHPALSATNVNQGSWLSEIGAGEQYSYATLRDKAVSLLMHPSSDDALDRAGVKYVIVPLRDTQSEDDFFRYYGDDRQYYIDRLESLDYLKRIDIGTTDVAVYENRSPQAHIGAFTSLQAFEQGDGPDINTYHPFITRQADEQFNFVDLAKQNSPNYPQATIKNIFEDIAADDISGQQVTKTLPAQQNPTLYIDPSNQHLRYIIDGSTIRFLAREEANLHVNGTSIDKGQDNEQVVATANLDPAKTYYLSVDGKPLALEQREGSRDLGIISQPLTVFATAGKNLVTNPSFEEGLWQQTVENCNNYDRQPSIAMRLRGGDATHGGRSLQLEASKHTACTTGEAITATHSSYLVSFDYKVSGGRAAGFTLQFNDKQQTVTAEDLRVDDTKWHTYRKIIQAPAGATSLRLQFKGYPDYRLQTRAIANFDKVSIAPLSTTLELPDPTGKPYRQVPLPADKTLAFSYPNRPREQSNRINNGSFESGTWQKQVADCNDYDGNPQLGMQLVGHGDGKALELSAQRHDACTSNSRTSVHENTNYMFNFSYQSPNANAASYFIRFNDPARTTIEESIPIKDSDWHAYSRQIKSPLGATHMTVVVYARASETGRTTILNRYDDFTLREIPDLPGRYFVVDAPKQSLKAPHKVRFHTLSATKKTIRISGAHGPFYLRMGEAYHPLWKLRPGTVQASDWLRAPWDTAGMLAESTHFRLNDFQNGWYIDPAAICRGQANCQQHADGSYDMQLVVEFLPQRWFYFGGILSLISLVAMASYGLWIFRKPDEKRKWLWRRS